MGIVSLYFGEPFLLLPYYFGLFLREALFPSGSEEKLMSFFFSVTRIIDFCERHREGVTRLLDLGGLSLGF